MLSVKESSTIFNNASLNDDRSYSPEWGIVSVLMISRVILKKLLSVGLMGSMGVGYVAYESRVGDAEGDGDQGNAMIMNASMFSASYVSNGSKKSSYNYQRNDKKTESASDGMSLTGRTGAYSYSRIGKTYKYD